MKPKVIAIFLIAFSSNIHWAIAQNDAQKERPTTCLNAKIIKAPQLYGIWQVTFNNPPAGLPKTAIVMLEKHQEFSDSLRGVVSRDPVTYAGHAAKAALAGDVEDGFVILDESSNNVSISGTWNGQLVEASCGRAIVGMWKDTSDSAPPDVPDVAFTMVKRPGW